LRKLKPDTETIVTIMAKYLHFLISHGGTYGKAKKCTGDDVLTDFGEKETSSALQTNNSREKEKHQKLLSGENSLMVPTQLQVHNLDMCVNIWQ
jgi:hypothetical protein